MFAQHPPHIGEIYLMDFAGSGSEQRGIRPGIVYQNNAGNTHSPNIVAIPITSAVKKLLQPTHVFLPAEIGLRMDSIALCENPQTMSKQRIGRLLTTLPDDYMQKIVVSQLLASSAIAFLDQETLLHVWRIAAAMNAA